VQGARTDAVDSSGQNALHIAAASNGGTSVHKLCKILLNADDGATRLSKDKAGHTPAEIALASGNKRAAELIAKFQVTNAGATGRLRGERMREILEREQVRTEEHLKISEHFARQAAAKLGLAS